MSSIKLLELKQLSERIERLDDELQRDCLTLIRPLVKGNRYKEAKRAVRDFYKVYPDAFSKDMCNYYINKQQSKYERDINTVQ